MARPEDSNLRMRMQVLRLRGELQRAEAAAALDGLRAGARRVGRALGVAGAVGDASAAGAGWAAPLFAMLRDRPWLLSLALVMLRSAKRHPAAAALAAAGLAVAWWARRGGENTSAEVERPAPTRDVPPDPPR
jgi:hypothetical protein